MKNLLKRLSKFTKIIITLIYLFLTLPVSAQNFKATLGQVNQLSVKIPNQKAEKCNIDVTFPNGSAQFDVSAPDYIANIAFTPSTEGQNTISWQGNFKRRGLNSVAGCESNGKIYVYVTPTNEVKAQRWTELASKISDKQKACISAGMILIKGNLNFSSISGDINVDVNEPLVKKIRGICESYADKVLMKNQSCKINDKDSYCDEIYTITIGSETKQFGDNELLSYVFKKEPIQIVSVENADGKAKRELNEIEEAKKLEAYKKTPAYKKEQAELAKKQAIEEARLKKEQAEMEKKRLAEEALARKESEQKIANMEQFIFFKPGDTRNTVSEEVFLDVCNKVEYWNTMGETMVKLGQVEIVLDLEIGASRVNDFVRTGGANVGLKDVYVTKSHKCMLFFYVKGIYEGTSVNLNAHCQVTRIKQFEKGKYQADDYSHGPIGKSCAMD